MKKVLLTMISLFLLVFALSGISYGWQGRMGGMGDPFGLVADESDYLIHPAKIANGEGVRFYGDYRFTYTGVTDWDYNLDHFSTAGTLVNVFHFDSSGQEFTHNVLLGATFPLGPGRMGLFFTYNGMRGNYHGDVDVNSVSNFEEYDLTKDFDNFALRLLYGLPVGSFKLGGEAQFAYCREKNENWIQMTNLIQGKLNDISGLFRPFENLLSFQFPYNSRYWETLFKGSLDGKIGPLDLEFTLRGGFLFGGENSLLMELQNPVGTTFSRTDLNGDVTGWRIGGDLWARYPLAKDLSLPFLVGVAYQQKTRDGDGVQILGVPPAFLYRYASEEKDLGLTVGGGIDKELGPSTKIAAGVYYNYLQGKNDIKLHYFASTGSGTDDSSDYPASTEHQVMLRLAGELALSPTINLRMGFAPFYGWVKENFKYTRGSLVFGSDTDDVSLDGYHWGIVASLGGTIKFKPITLEPFINGGWQQLHLKGDGDRVDFTGAVTRLYDMSKDRDEWYIGGGFSVLYDL